MNIKKELKDFYDQEANKFHNTRKKHWPEFDHILKIVKKSKKRNINILELGCGSWRFLWYLQENTKKKINYTWVDISDWLIDIAKHEYPEWNFFSMDMVSALQQQNQWTYDFVIAIASFQHLPTYKERLLALKNIYRILNYWGECIMVNWSFSKWFWEKYRNQVIKSFFKQFLGKYKFNDIFVPWKQDNSDKIFYRYYHIFTHSELRKLSKHSWFILEELSYIDKEGNISTDWKDSRNSFFVAKKDVI